MKTSYKEWCDRQIELITKFCIQLDLPTEIVEQNTNGWENSKKNADMMESIKESLSSKFGELSWDEVNKLSRIAAAKAILLVNEAEEEPIDIDPGDPYYPNKNQLNDICDAYGEILGVKIDGVFRIQTQHVFNQFGG